MLQPSAQTHRVLDCGESLIKVLDTTVGGVDKV